ncbi:MAG: hypothetical protein WC373_10050 [Smithella sp.]
MSYGVAQVCIRTGDAKIREGFGFLKSGPEIINGSFKMIGR